MLTSYKYSLLMANSPPTMAGMCRGYGYDYGYGAMVMAVGMAKTSKHGEDPSPSPRSGVMDLNKDVPGFRGPGEAGVGVRIQA